MALNFLMKRIINSLLITSITILVFICFSVNHPVLITALVIVISLVVSLMTYQISYFWIFLALILIFLGGVIILFVYITTLANNEKLVIPNFSKTRVVLLILARLIFSFSVFNQPLFRLIPALGIYFNPISGRNLILLTLYLLMALTRVVKLRQRTRGSLIRWS